MKLYYHPVSTTSRIVTMFAEEEGIPLDYEVVDLVKGEHLEPEYRAINPNCLVPTLDDDGFILTESGAIIRYLANKTGSAAYPSGARERARVDERMDWLYGNVVKDLAYGLAYPQLFPTHKRATDELQAGTLAWAKEKTAHWLGILDEQLLGPEQRFLCGNEITLADYVGAELIALGELVHCRYDDYPNVRRWLGNMKALKSWSRVHEVADGFAASLKDKEFVSI